MDADSSFRAAKKKMKSHTTQSLSIETEELPRKTLKTLEDLQVQHHLDRRKASLRTRALSSHAKLTNFFNARSDKDIVIETVKSYELLGVIVDLVLTLNNDVLSMKHCHNIIQECMNRDLSDLKFVSQDHINIQLQLDTSSKREFKHCEELDPPSDEDEHEKDNNTLELDDDIPLKFFQVNDDNVEYRVDRINQIVEMVYMDYIKKHELTSNFADESMVTTICHDEYQQGTSPTHYQDSIKVICTEQNKKPCGTKNVFGSVGGRVNMEDRLQYIPLISDLYISENEIPNHPCHISYYAIFDGHLGNNASEYIRIHLHNNIMNIYEQLLKEYIANEREFNIYLVIQVLECAIHRGYKVTNQRFIQLAQSEELNSGSTAVTAFLIEEKLTRERYIIIAHVGDSQGFIYKASDSDDDLIYEKGSDQELASRIQKLIPHTHRASNEKERVRVENLGAKVIYFYGQAKVNGVISVTRAFGNLKHRKYIRCDPEIDKFRLESQHKFFLLASDGLFDVMSECEISRLVLQLQKEQIIKINDISKHVVNEAIARGATDNVSVATVML